MRERALLSVVRACDLYLLFDGMSICFAVSVIGRQRPGTAHGFIFLSIEDETGIANAIIDPKLYEKNRTLVTCTKFLLIEGTLQNTDGVVHIRARTVRPLQVTAAPVQSHDFH